MQSTNLKSDDFCGYNQSGAPNMWTFQKGQYKNTFAVGETGIFPAANYIRPSIIDTSSFLSGRDDILSLCNPPQPAIEVERMENIKPNGNPKELIPKYTREKKSAIALSEVDYQIGRFQPELLINPQDPDHIIEAMSAQRGGLSTQQFAKQAWLNRQCTINLDPNRVGMNTRENTALSEVSGATQPPATPLQWKQPNSLDFKSGKPYSAGVDSSILITIGQQAPEAGPQAAPFPGNVGIRNPPYFR